VKMDGRDDRGRDVFEDGAAGVERELRRLVPAAAPPGLRGRVVARAAEARRGALLAPWMRVSAVACSVLIVTVLGIDPLIVRHEAVRMAALLGVAGGSEPTERESDFLWAELGVDMGVIDRALRGGIARFGSKGSEASLRDHLQARDRLKGMTDYENAEGLN